MIINSKTCIIEMTPPRRDSKTLDKGLQRFSERFQRVMNSGFIASLSDNVMGIPHPQPVELIKELKLTPQENQVIVHINTFHTKEELDFTLEFCKSHGIGTLLCLTGDGSDELPKLTAEDLYIETGAHRSSEVDASKNSEDRATVIPEITSVDLVKYIKTKYPKFTCAVAFNPYEPAEQELDKMRRKVEAGADFVITQPILEKNEQVDKLMEEFPELPVIIECWFSKKIELLFDIIGRDMPEDFQYDGYDKLLELRTIYPDSGNCMSMIGFKVAYGKVEKLWNGEN